MPTNNAIDISSQGTVYYNGTTAFVGIDGSTAGKVLTSNGTGIAPSFQTASGSGAFTALAVQVFTSTGTYTPTSGMKYCRVVCVGGGGGAGGIEPNGAVNNQCCAGGGGGGGYSEKTFAAATIGASQAVTIGAAGSAGAGAGNGGNGGTTSLGALLTATGGIGSVKGSGNSFNAGGAGGSGTLGDFICSGEPGGWSMAEGIATGTGLIAGNGGSSFFGGGGIASTFNTNSAGQSYGGGGSGRADNTGVGGGGAAGFKGICVVYEYI